MTGGDALRMAGVVFAAAMLQAVIFSTVIAGGGSPNLLLVVVDSLRFDAISRSAGAARTPNLERLATDGIAFPWCFSPTPDSFSAHAALLSARTPAASRSTDETSTVPADLPLVAAWLAESDYRTAAAVGLSAFGNDGPRTGLERGFRTVESLSAAKSSARC